MRENLNRIYRGLVQSTYAQNGNSLDSFSKKFQLLCALYDSLSQTIKTDADAKDAVSTFLKLREKIEKKLDEKESRVHNYDFQPDLLGLEIALVKFLPAEDLIFWLDSYRDEFRNVAGEEVYSAYLHSKGYKQSMSAQPLKDVIHRIYIRADANFLLGQILRYQLLREKAETARSYLLRRLRKYSLMNLLIFCLPILLFFTDILFLRGASAFLPNDKPIDSVSPNGFILSRIIAHVALLGFAACFGVIGAFLSAANRIQRLSGNLELARDTYIFKNSADQLRLSPLTGAISAVLLYYIFGGGFIEGTLFPKAHNNSSWYNIFLYHQEFSKLIVWSFIAGFSERFVPDLLDRFVSQTKTDKRTERALPLQAPASQIVLETGLQASPEPKAEEKEDPIPFRAG